MNASVMQAISSILDCSQTSTFSCFSSIVGRGERAASELAASAKREARGGGGGEVQSLQLQLNPHNSNLQRKSKKVRVIEGKLARK